MDPRLAARVLTLGRVAFGVVLLAAPSRAASRWLGAAVRRPGAQVVIESLGARDIAIGAGGAWAMQGNADPRPWLLAGAVADLADLAGTLRHREALPTTGVIGVGALAGGAAAAGVWLATRLDQPSTTTRLE